MLFLKRFLRAEFPALFYSVIQYPALTEKLIVWQLLFFMRI